MHVQLAGVTKHHGAKTILEHVELSVDSGSRVGVVGPNGVGKTTLLRLLAGLDRSDSGTVVRAATALSGGEAARASLAAVLLSRFDVLCLDEPTNNLDFDGLERLERFLAGYAGARRTAAGAERAA
jgi:ATPase subunit of ABC transporter with duplicated ATPase domains